MNLISGDFDFFWKDIAGFRRINADKQRNIHVRFSTLLKTYCLKCRKQKKPCTTTMCVANGKHVGIIWQKVKSQRATKNDTGVPNRQ